MSLSVETERPRFHLVFEGDLPQVSAISVVIGCGIVFPELQTNRTISAFAAWDWSRRSFGCRFILNHRL